VTYRRCNGKDHPEDKDRFYPKRDGACPHCGDESVFNKALYTSMLNSHLYSQVAQQRGEAEFAKKARKEKEPF
jgi:hypothetical protein